MKIRLSLLIVITFIILTIFYPKLWGKEFFKWGVLPHFPQIGNQSGAIGVAGPFAGVHNDVFIIAGGTNFDKPVWENEKVWHDDIWVLEDVNGKYRWQNRGKLIRPIACGASVSTEMGLICIGGNDVNESYSDAFLIQWFPKKKNLEKVVLPQLPGPFAFGSAAKIGKIVYVAGGSRDSNLQNAMKNFWCLDLEDLGTDDFKWKELPPWPGPNRAFNITVAQHNGKEDCIYVISGRRERVDRSIQFLQDVYEFSPQKYKEQQQLFWRRVADIPTCVMAGPGIAVGQSHIFVLGGDDGSLFYDAENLKEMHPGFPKQVWAYHTITNQWFPVEKLPENHVTTNAVWWQNKIIIPSGEIKPRIGTPQILTAEPIQIKPQFETANFITLFIYLVLLIVMGIYFSNRNKNTDDFFRGGQRVPWWVAGLSIFATMLSSITFIAIPAKAYATDWTFFLINMAIIAVAPFIIHFILPFFRRIDATSAYEYLEKRFNTAARLFASASFVFFQLGRMAIVMFLPSLALAAITPLSVESSILLMGVMSIVYCTIGGLEAVVWTDTLQAFVLLGGALFSIVFIFYSIEGGVGAYFSTALTDHKFHLINWNWDYNGFTFPVLWVVVMGGLGQQLVTGTSDQSIIQRYMSVSDEKKAAKAIWTNAVFTFPASILFFGVGTALYVFYKFHPEKLDPTFQTDAVFPLFIGHELPVGIAGLVVAGIFAAAQSTISTSMNSTATAIVTDFIRRFNVVKSEKNYLILARILTFTLGVFGTGFALVLAASDIKSLWDSFMKILGLLGGPLCGMFLLGMLTKRANGIGALLGAGLGVIFLAYIQQNTTIHFLLYASFGIFNGFICGYLFSILFSRKMKNIDGLTVYSLPKHH